MTINDYLEVAMKESAKADWWLDLGCYRKAQICTKSAILAMRRVNDLLKKERVGN